MVILEDGRTNFCNIEFFPNISGVAIIFLIIGHGSGGAIGYVIRSKKKCKPEQSVKTSDHKLSETSEIKASHLMS